MSKTVRNKSHISRSAGDRIFDAFVYVLFTLFTILCVFPFYYLFINTISNNDAVTSGRVNFYPVGFHLNNYIALKDVSDLGSSIIVTIARTVIGTALMVLVSAWAGYMVTKQKMWKRSFMYRALVITMYFNAGLMPWYMNMMMLGLTGSFMAYIIPGMIAPYNIILVKTYIESIPTSLEESAVIDGANTPTVFTKIILPLSVPILATIAIFGAVGNWNSFQDSLLLMQEKPEMFTLQHRLYVYLNQSSNLGALVSGSGQLTQAQADTMLSSRVTKYTISMVSIIPILCVYPFMQRFFVKGIMLGAVKG
ncbi:MAG: carbohydrate ABC transporter permease [Aristaeellaceae bacterium]